MNESGDWLKVNQRVLATCLGELSYEQVLRPTPDEGQRAEIPQAPPYVPYVLRLASGVSYEFLAWRGIWDHLRILPGSISRIERGTREIAGSAGQFFVDSRHETAMSETTLGCFLEELQNTLYSDLHLLEAQRKHSVDEISDWDGGKIQSILSGHPKLFVNKGRLGWGERELLAYAPEHEPAFRLMWIAVRKSEALASVSDQWSFDGLLNESLDEKERERFQGRWASLGLDSGAHLIVPVHPWQWERIIAVQFASEIAKGTLVPLGTYGDFYCPQISIRTLRNVSRPKRLDIKLPLNILNTSAYRGISPRYIASGPSLSKAFAALCENDSVLRERRMQVLEEVAGVSVGHPLFKQVKGAPYRFHESLGAIWRRSADETLGANEKAILTGALFYQDTHGRSLLGAYVKKSGLKLEEWLMAYFDHVVVPLYHLQLKYGIGLVAHGQNVIVRLTDHRPSGVFVKDFQGDLRIRDDKFEELQSTLGPGVSDLTRLPAAHLIHDLLTGHFSTVLRFVSETLFECERFPESRFYRALADSVSEYVRATWSEGDVPHELDLLRARIERVVVNKVRFKIGYSDSAERPLPMLGDDLENPLHISSRERKAAI